MLQGIRNLVGLDQGEEPILLIENPAARARPEPDGETQAVKSRGAPPAYAPLSEAELLKALVDEFIPENLVERQLLAVIAKDIHLLQSLQRRMEESINAPDADRRADYRDALVRTQTALQTKIMRFLTEFEQLRHTANKAWPRTATPHTRP